MQYDDPYITKIVTEGISSDEEFMGLSPYLNANGKRILEVPPDMSEEEREVARNVLKRIMEYCGL